MDSLMRSGYSTVSGTAASPYPHVIQAANPSRVMVTAGGTVRGGITSSDNELVGKATLNGKLSLGMVGGMVLLLMAMYLWTRNVQGGG